MDPMETAVKVILFFIPFLFSLCFHEFAHGFVAKLRGDKTAEMMGRLTLNPMPHIDWMGTVALPIISIITHLPLFGWAKPVPVNPRNLKDPKNDMFWVAIAGPLSNVLLFVVGLVLTFILVRTSVIPVSAFYAGELNAIAEMLKIFLLLNLFLAFFNMLPLHPLDGGKVLERFIPFSWSRWLHEHQYQLNLALLFLIIFGGFRILARPVYAIVEFSLGFVLGVA